MPEYPLSLTIRRADKPPQALDTVRKWPLLTRNKVQDSKVYIPVEGFAESENEQVKAAAQEVRSSVFLCLSKC